MSVERFDCVPGTDITSLTRSLEPLGASVTVMAQPSSGVVVHLPDDEYREKRCRQIVEEWQCRQGGPMLPADAGQPDTEKL